MHYYSFNIADYRKDTVHLTPIEHYIYRTLLDNYYLDEKPIPKKTQSVLRRLSLGSEEDEKALKNVLDDFFEEQDDGFHHIRVDEEIEKYHENAEKNRRNGKKGGRPRKNKPKKTQSVSSGLPDESEKKPNQEPLTNNHKPVTNNNTGENELNIPFDEFWNLYGKKRSRAKCEKKWSKLKDSEREAVMSHLPAYIQSTPDVQFRKDPYTYLNNQSWEDEIINSTAVITNQNQGANNANSDKLNELEQFINNYGSEQNIRNVN